MPFYTDPFETKIVDHLDKDHRAPDLMRKPPINDYDRPVTHNLNRKIDDPFENKVDLFEDSKKRETKIFPDPPKDKHRSVVYTPKSKPEPKPKPKKKDPEPKKKDPEPKKKNPEPKKKEPEPKKKEEQKDPVSSKNMTKLERQLDKPPERNKYEPIAEENDWDVSPVRPPPPTRQRTPPREREYRRSPPLIMTRHVKADYYPIERNQNSNYEDFNFNLYMFYL